MFLGFSDPVPFLDDNKTIQFSGCFKRYICKNKNIVREPYSLECLEQATIHSSFIFCFQNKTKSSIFGTYLLYIFLPFVFFTAPLTITAGTVRVGDAGGLLDSQQVTVNSGATLDLNDVGQTLTGLRGAGTVNLGAVNAGGLTFNPGLNDSSVFSGVISGNSGVSKSGEGIQILSGGIQLADECF